MGKEYGRRGGDWGGAFVDLEHYGTRVVLYESKVPYACTVLTVKYQGSTVVSA